MTLLKRLLGRPAAGQRPAAEVQSGPPRPDRSVTVIGDVHGRADLLAELLDRLSGDGAVVTVGDYIDRGDRSAQVLEALCRAQRAAPDDVICLKGNHEQMMLEFLDRPQELGSRWLRNGGLQTLASFDVGAVTETSGPDDLLRASEALRAALPDGMADWLRGLPLAWHCGTLSVVHAGADPALPMEAQAEDVLLWGHRDFFSVPRTDGRWIAHGHTVVDAPQMRDSRIAVDTGAYFSGRLTAAQITPEGSVTFRQTGPG